VMGAVDDFTLNRGLRFRCERGWLAMPQPVEGVVADDEDRGEFGLMRLEQVSGELQGIEKLQAAVLAISVRYATRALVDQAAADRELPREIERLAAGIRERVEKLRAELAMLRPQNDIGLAQPGSPALVAAAERPPS
jgi:hypothetical protein